MAAGNTFTAAQGAEHPPAALGDGLGIVGDHRHLGSESFVGIVAAENGKIPADPDVVPAAEGIQVFERTSRHDQHLRRGNGRDYFHQSLLEIAVSLLAVEHPVGIDGQMIFGHQPVVVQQAHDLNGIQGNILAPEVDVTDAGISEVPQIVELDDRHVGGVPERDHVVGSMPGKKLHADLHFALQAFGEIGDLRSADDTVGYAVPDQLVGDILL